MDTLEKYRQIVEKILTEHAAIPYAYGEIERRTLFNREDDNYLLYIVGWDDHERVHGIVTHIDIINEKIWIQRDGTEDGVAAELENAGIPKDKIVLAFQEPSIRKYTDYAIA